MVLPPTLVSRVGLFSWMRVGVDAMLVPAHESIEPGAAIPFKATVDWLGSLSPNLLSVVWLFGSIVYGASVLVRCRAFSNLLLNSITKKPDRLRVLTQSIAKRMGAPDDIRVVVSREPIGPAVLGVWRPTIVLPEAVASQSHDQLEPILAHEVLHVKRRDILLTLFIIGSKVVWWFNPLIWFAAARVSQFNEHTCDLDVIRFLKVRRARYARCLVNVLESKQTFRPVLDFPGVRASQLTAERIRTIMTVPVLPRSRARQWFGMGVILILVGIVIPGRAPALPPVDAPPRPDITCIKSIVKGDVGVPVIDDASLGR